MDRIKDLTKVKMYMGSVLIKIKMKSTLIKSPDDKASKPLVEYAEIISLSPDITDLAVGDIVLDFRTAEAFDYKGGKYSIIPRMNIKVAVDKDNFTKKIDSTLN